MTVFRESKISNQYNSKSILCQCFNFPDTLSCLIKYVKFIGFISTLWQILSSYTIWVYIKSGSKSKYKNLCLLVFKIDYNIFELKSYYITIGLRWNNMVFWSKNYFVTRDFMTFSQFYVFYVGLVNCLSFSFICAMVLSGFFLPMCLNVPWFL